MHVTYVLHIAWDRRARSAHSKRRGHSSRLAPCGTAVRPSWGVERHGPRVNFTCRRIDQAPSTVCTERQREGRVEKPPHPLAESPATASGAVLAPLPGILGSEDWRAPCERSLRDGRPVNAPWETLVCNVLRIYEASQNADQVVRA
jgi:hypothetical protein